LLDDLAQVEPQSAPQQLTLVKRSASRAFHQQRAQLLVQAD
jgi:hypothetical protein